MIAVIIGAVILMAANSSFVDFMKARVNFGKKSQADLSLRTANTNFVTAIESATFSVRFQNMPIAVSGCAADPTKACLRQLGENNTWLAPTFAASDISFPSQVANTGAPPSIQFFRDDEGTITQLVDSSVPTLKTSVTQNLKLSAEAITTPLFVTYPLTDENSPPFTILRATTDGAFLVMPDSFMYGSEAGTDNLVAKNSPAGFHNYSFFKASTLASSINQLKGLILIVYNSNNSQQFVAKAIKNVIRCSDTAKASQAELSSLGDSASSCIPYDYRGSKEDQAGIAIRNTELANPANKLVALELESLSNKTNARFFSNYFPSKDQLGFSAATTGLSWPADNAPEAYSLPSTTSSFVDSHYPLEFQGPTEDSGNGTDTRHLLHYVSNQLKGQIYGVPAVATAYYIKNPGTGSKQLVASNFDVNGSGSAGTKLGDRETILNEQITGPVIFARRLGTLTVGMYMYSTSADATAKKTSALWLPQPSLLGGLDRFAATGF